MADPRSRGDRYQVRFDYTFDRLFSGKLQQVYELLVPGQVRIVGECSRVRENSNDGCGDLRMGVVGPAAGGEHHR
jgi:hypothetical protein